MHGGKAFVTEACHEWMKRNAVTLPKFTAAVEKFNA